MGQGTRGDGDAWFQRLIASALSIGISKRELLEDYYMDEIGEVIRAWNNLHGAGDQEEQVDGAAFLGSGGEWV